MYLVVGHVMWRGGEVGAVVMEAGCHLAPVGWAGGYPIEVRSSCKWEVVRHTVQLRLEVLINSSNH